MADAPPSNERAFQVLCDALRSGNAIAVVCSGASAGVYPSRRQLDELVVGQAVDRQSKQGPDEPAADVGLIVQQAISGALVSAARPYTDIQEALIRLPFAGYVLMGHDPGLLYARQSLGLANDLHSDTWMDQDRVEAWQYGKALGEEPCPILYLHGRYDRPETVLLTEDHPPAAVLTDLVHLSNLFGSHPAAAVGVTERDFAVPGSLLVARAAGADGGSPPKVVLFGWPPGVETHEAERSVLSESGWGLYTYPVKTDPSGNEDHSALLEVLQRALAEVGERPELKDRKTDEAREAAGLPKVATDEATDRDGLGMDTFARTVAAVITHKGTQPPLAIAVSGPWGSGNVRNEDGPAAA